jgi:hypothetical protein
MGIRLVALHSTPQLCNRYSTFFTHGIPMADWQRYHTTSQFSQEKKKGEIKLLKYYFTGSMENAIYGVKKSTNV